MKAGNATYRLCADKNPIGTAIDTTIENRINQ